MTGCCHGTFATPRYGGRGSVMVTCRHSEKTHSQTCPARGGMVVLNASNPGWLPCVRADHTGLIMFIPSMHLSGPAHSSLTITAPSPGT